MIDKQVSLFDYWDVQHQQVLKQDAKDDVGNSHLIVILLSALAAKAISDDHRLELIATLTPYPQAIAIAQSFSQSKLVRELRLKHNSATNQLPKLDFQGNQVIYQGQVIGETKLLFKSPLPGELQAKLAIESAIERFLEYLQKVYYIVALNESARHVLVFIPGEQHLIDLKEIWDYFIKKVAFSAYGDTKHQLPGLVQTFIVMLNAITLSGRGFSTLEVPILTKEQSNVLAAWYFAVIRDVGERQKVRQSQIEQLRKYLESSDLSDKERKSKEKDLQAKEVMQDKEAKKYTEYFQKSFTKDLETEKMAWQELKTLEIKLLEPGLSKSEQRKLQNQQIKLKEKVFFSQDSAEYKINLINQAGGNPFNFVQLDKKQNPDKFKVIDSIAKNFKKTATDQINSTRGDIFTQCIYEMYRLLENPPSDPLPEPLLTEHSILPEVRSPGDESREFCYSCGVAIAPKTARWQVLRFMFERPSQRRQSASGEGRPHICASCSALAFASPLKVTDESIILKLEPSDKSAASELKVKDYIRMLTNKELHLSAGRYLLLASDKTNTGDLASQKLGQVQYTLAKVASIFPVEVLTDFNFFLITQSSQPIPLKSRHLVFIKGLIEGYSQSIIASGKDINMTLGDAVRYVEQDLPFLADYTLTKVAGVSKNIELEKIREYYWKTVQKDLKLIGVSMSSQMSKRATLYRDVAALTGLTYAFAQSLESTARKARKQEDVEREVSKLIEKVDDAVAFCYYATLGDEKKTSVQARLYENPENYFIYAQAKDLLEQLKIVGREEKDDAGKNWLNLYADDVINAYAHFAQNDYAQEKDWKELTYQLKLSLYTRFPELVRKLKSTSEK